MMRSFKDLNQCELEAKTSSTQVMIGGSELKELIDWPLT